MLKILNILYNTMEESHYLVKSFDSIKFSNTFYISGEMMISRIDYFHNLEKNIRQDNFDGKVVEHTTFYHNDKKIVSIGNGNKIEIIADMSKIDKKSIMYWVHSYDQMDYIYSMSAYVGADEYHQLKNKQINYGSYCVVITKELEFVRRFIYNLSFVNRFCGARKSLSNVEKDIRDYFERNRWKNSQQNYTRHLWSYEKEEFISYVGFGLVKYSDKKSKDEFTKAKKFQFDSEFRITYNDTQSRELTKRVLVKIGNIDDISIRCSKENLFSTLLLAIKSRGFEGMILNEY